MAGKYENDHAELVHLLSRLDMLQFDRPKVKSLGMWNQWQFNPYPPEEVFGYMWYHNTNQDCRYICGYCISVINSIDEDFLTEFCSFRDLLHDIYMKQCTPGDYTIEKVLVKWDILEPKVEELKKTLINLDKVGDKVRNILDTERDTTLSLLQRMKKYTNHYKNLK